MHEYDETQRPDFCPNCGAEVSRGRREPAADAYMPAAAAISTDAATAPPPGTDSATGPALGSNALVASKRTTDTTVLLLLIRLALSAVCVAAEYRCYSLFSRLDSGLSVAQEEAEAIGALTQTVSIANLVAAIVSFVAFLYWLYVHSRNAHALNASPLRFSPGWSVGCFFVPIANLWKPYQAMNELWAASDPDRSVQPANMAPGPAVIKIWWAATVVSGFLGYHMWSYSEPDSTYEALQATRAAIQLEIVSAIPAICMIVMVRRIRQMQLAMQERLIAAGSSSSATPMAPSASIPAA
jgi:hypothetical protein